MRSLDYVCGFGKWESRSMVDMYSRALMIFSFLDSSQILGDKYIRIPIFPLISYMALCHVRRRFSH